MTKNGFISVNLLPLAPTTMSQLREDYPLWMDCYDNETTPEPDLWRSEMVKTPEIHPALLEAVERAIEAEVDILDWAAETNPEHDPDNYTCWNYDEYKEYMRQEFAYVPNSFWKWFNMDDMILQFWRDRQYDLVYYDGEQPMLVDDTWRTASGTWNVDSWFKTSKTKFYILQYGLPPAHPLL